MYTLFRRQLPRRVNFNWLVLKIKWKINMCVCCRLGGTKEEVVLKLWKSKGGWKSAPLHCCHVSPCCCRLGFVRRYFHRLLPFFHCIDWSLLTIRSVADSTLRSSRS